MLWLCSYCPWESMVGFKLILRIIDFHKFTVRRCPGILSLAVCINQVLQYFYFLLFTITVSELLSGPNKYMFSYFIQTQEVNSIRVKTRLKIM